MKLWCFKLPVRDFGNLAQQWLNCLERQRVRANTPPDEAALPVMVTDLFGLVQFRSYPVALQKSKASALQPSNVLIINA
jgi:hypothetical protein